MSHITILKAENFMKITAAEVRPSGSMTVVGGENEQGKSSLLTAFEFLFKGAKALPPVPVHTGAKRAAVTGTIEPDTM